ncbi:hypothetical protein PF003_g23147 [Phytophthora fragariae]|nr:hypothetical protein PF003_g23147 [Phytophthora fragariae]
MDARLGAPCHLHLFSARLDVAIDGTTCHVDKQGLKEGRALRLPRPHH